VSLRRVLVLVQACGGIGGQESIAALCAWVPPILY